MLKLIFGVDNARELKEKLPDVSVESLTDETYPRKKGAVKKIMDEVLDGKKRVVQRGIKGDMVVNGDGKGSFPGSFTLAPSYLSGADAYTSLTCTSQPFNQLLAVTIGSAREHEGRRLIPVMQSISVRHDGRGRARKRPKTLYADTKYNMPLNKFYLDGKHVRSQMPDPPGKKKRPGRSRAFDKHASNHVRSMIERFNGWVKAFRRVAIRYDRLPQVYMGFVHLACIMVYLRVLQ